MLIIRGNTRVADVFLAEFMLLFNHFRIRNEVNAMSPREREASRHLATDVSWMKLYFEKGSQLEKEWMLFANVGVGNDRGSFFKVTARPVWQALNCPDPS